MRQRKGSERYVTEPTRHTQEAGFADRVGTYAALLSAPERDIAADTALPCPIALERTRNPPDDWGEGQ